MCGRFSLGVDTDRLIHEFGLAEITTRHEPRFNIAPTQDVPAVVRGPGGLRLGSLRWGLLPAHARSGGAPLINARSETVRQRRAFADSFRWRRCWVLADGFYEWTRGADGARLPFHIRPTHGRPFAFAGIWDRPPGDARSPASCAILTTRPADALAEIHDRMPVILAAEDRDLWLDPDAGPDALSALLRPCQDVEVRRVSRHVNSAAHEGPACLEPRPGATTHWLSPPARPDDPQGQCLIVYRPGPCQAGLRAGRPSGGWNFPPDFDL